MQDEWRKEIVSISKCDWQSLYEYDFKNTEWTIKDYEQSPLCQIIWGEIIAKYLHDHLKNNVYKNDYKYEINRYALKVYNTENKEESYRFLFDVMYNLKKRYVTDSSDNEKYHFIGNFAPLPANESPKRSLQLIHKDNNEDWSIVMKYLSEHWDEFKMNGLTFEKYKSMVFLEDSRFCVTQNCVKSISELVQERGKTIQQRAEEALLTSK
jgi:hypothetical protein